jgi:hypothetical protein
MARESENIYFEHEGKKIISRLNYASKVWFYWGESEYLFSWTDDKETLATLKISKQNFLKCLEREERMKRKD